MMQWTLLLEHPAALCDRGIVNAGASEEVEGVRDGIDLPYSTLVLPVVPLVLLSSMVPPEMRPFCRIACVIVSVMRVKIGPA